MAPEKKNQITAMSRDVPPLSSPNAPSAAVTNNQVSLALLAHPSPASPASHRYAQVTNLFQDVAKKHIFDLPSTGYSPAKKKGGRCTRNAEISPCDMDEFANASLDVDNNDDEDYSPTPAYKIVCTMRPKKQDAKITLDSSYFAFLCWSTFDTKQFIRSASLLA